MVFPLFLPLFLLFNVTIVQTVLFRCQQFSNSQTKRIALMAKDLRIGFLHFVESRTMRIEDGIHLGRLYGVQMQPFGKLSLIITARSAVRGGEKRLHSVATPDRSQQEARDDKEKRFCSQFHGMPILKLLRR